MKKYVSPDKLSKKKRREYYSGRRRTWGDLNPVTRSVPSGKIYNRKKEKQRIGREFNDGFHADPLSLKVALRRGWLYIDALQTKACLSLLHPDPSSVNAFLEEFLDRAACPPGRSAGTGAGAAGGTGTGRSAG